MYKIAICILTRNRPKEFQKTFDNWNEFKPKDSVIYVVDDASDEPYCKADFRFSERVGIPKAKNKCLELAFKSGAEYIFLSEDDCYPKKEGFELPYINSGINHLNFTFTGAYTFALPRPTPLVKDGLRIHKLPSGCMMFFTREVLQSVGGFDERFGIGLYEHVEFSRRIYNTGLTPYPFIDVCGSELYFHSMDEHNEVKRSFTLDERKKLLKQGEILFKESKKSSKFIPFM